MNFIDILNNTYNKSTPMFTVTEKVGFLNKKYFHVSSNPDLDSVVLQPRVPGYLNDKEKTKNLKKYGLYENDKTPRVCFSSSIEGCLNAIFSNGDVIVSGNDLMYVYIPEKPIEEYKRKMNKELVKDKDVYDAEATGEVWILEPVRLKLYGVISIEKYYNVKQKPIISSKEPNATMTYVKIKWRWTVPPKVARGLNESYNDILLEAEGDEDAPTDYGEDDGVEDTVEEEAPAEETEGEEPTDTTSEEETTEETEEDEPTDYSEDEGEIPAEVGDEESDETDTDDTSTDDTSTDTTTEEEKTDGNSIQLYGDFILLYNSLINTINKLDKCKYMDMITSQTVAKTKDNVSRLSNYIENYLNTTFKKKTYAENLYTYTYVVQLYKICVRMLSKINEFKPIQ